METVWRNIDSGKGPGKKYRNSNRFVDTKLPYIFPLDCFTTIHLTVKHIATGREGLFVLLTDRPLISERAVGLYRARNRIEDAFTGT